jgi:hypothetical protein
MSEFKLEKRKLSDLIADVHRGDIQLPQFQRAYKWKPKAVMKLIDSLNKLHPAGSLLFLEIDSTKTSFIAYEKVRTAPSTASAAKPNFLILDGQQRLTSCHSALTNSGSKTYFIDLKVLKSKFRGNIDNLDLVDDKIIVVKNNVTQPDQLLFSQHLLPFSFLLRTDDPSKSKEELRKKLYNYKENLRSGANYDKELLKFCETELDNFLDSFFDYQFPTIILPKSLDVAGVCKVFQTLNTTGIKLTAFDICVATLIPEDIKLKEKLNTAILNRPNINAILKDDETIILQTIALIANIWPKKNNLPKNLKASHILSHWDKAEEHLDLCVTILDMFGLGISKATDLLPYQPVVPVIAAALANSNYKSFNHSDQNKINNLIKRWFYNVCLNLRYTEGTDNKMKEDCGLLVEWILNNKEPEYIKAGVEWKTEKFITANKNGAFGKAIMIAINSRNLTDFYSSELVGFGNQVKIPCQQHHIFPNAKYRSQANISSVFNFTFITTKSNQFIKDKRTNEYINDILHETQITINSLKAKLLLHFIDENCYQSLKNQNFEEFLIKRAENIFLYLKEEIGINLSTTNSEGKALIDIEEDDPDPDGNFDLSNDLE